MIITLKKESANFSQLLRQIFTHIEKNDWGIVHLKLPWIFFISASHLMMRHFSCGSPLENTCQCLILNDGSQKKMWRGHPKRSRVGVSQKSVKNWNIKVVKIFIFLTTYLWQTGFSALIYQCNRFNAEWDTKLVLTVGYTINKNPCNTNNQSKILKI